MNGKSTVIQRTIQLARKVCSVKSTVLILGESGVGKEVFAKAIHEASEAAKAPFISINCGAIPEALFESELFGYERGAFSGANSKGKKGK
ncbi:sigma-54 factor interaction domain-containing protein, partial [Acinetobacter baumannii]|nr:sigma-54 factor interaction domain-containing protein [Acinetobacter baumannii]